MNVSVELSPPSAEVFVAFRTVCGWGDISVGEAEAALRSSIVNVTCQSESGLIGMGRVVGDGLHVQVVDIAVHPDWQGQGLSRMIMEKIMEFVDTLPASTIVNLFADIDWLYQKFGFVVPEHTTGMSLRRNG